jgi:hypothetical protein
MVGEPRQPYLPIPGISAHNPHLPEDPVDITQLKSPHFYPAHEKKVFFGHYWITGEPELCRDNICCLDYSVAKGGKLVAGKLDWEDGGWGLRVVNFDYSFW